ncbi:MAG: hypothetical protein K2M50_01740 [Treponemataceae bacterium]|nr:hypothetical protein [Treponemataceae bacterium]
MNNNRNHHCKSIATKKNLFAGLYFDFENTFCKSKDKGLQPTSQFWQWIVTLRKAILTVGRETCEFCLAKLAD